MLPLSAEAPQTAAPQQINLAEWLAGGKLQAVNRDVTAWRATNEESRCRRRRGPARGRIEGSDFDQGTIEIDVRGRDVLQQSFLGIAFHGKDDKTYEAVYLRPFNFERRIPIGTSTPCNTRSPITTGRACARSFPEEFENPVDASVAPTIGSFSASSSKATPQIFVARSTRPHSRFASSERSTGA